MSVTKDSDIKKLKHEYSEFSEDFIEYAIIKGGKNLTRKYLIGLYRAMDENTQTMIKNKQLAVFNKEAIPTYRAFLRGRGYSLGEVKETSSGYVAKVMKN
jgi:hypothetical protein